MKGTLVLILALGVVAVVLSRENSQQLEARLPIEPVARSGASGSRNPASVPTSSPTLAGGVAIPSGAISPVVPPPSDDTRFEVGLTNPPSPEYPVSAEALQAYEKMLVGESTGAEWPEGFTPEMFAAGEGLFLLAPEDPELHDRLDDTHEASGGTGS